MELVLYQYYSRDAILAHFGEIAAAQTFCDDEFVVLPQVTLCLFTIRSGFAPSHFTAPSSFIWRPQGQPDIEDRSFPWLPIPVRTSHRHIMFVRTDPTQEYLYVGWAHLGSYGRAGQDVRASYSLATKLPRHAWLAVGGSLAPLDPFPHLRIPSAPSAALSFHQGAFDLLHLPPQLSKHAAQQLQELEYQNNLSFPMSVREWYSLVGAMDIMRAISLMHTPADIVDYDDDLIRRYAATPPYLYMLPVIFENQGVWHLAVATNMGDDPPVYLGYQGEDTFEWHLHAERFSDFVYSWVWDYVSYERDYIMNMSTYMSDASLTSIQATFELQVTTYMANAYFGYERIERYGNGDQKITLMIGSKGTDTWFSAETTASLEALFRGPWFPTDKFEQIMNVDLEMQKMYLW